MGGWREGVPVCLLSFVSCLLNDLAPPIIVPILITLIIVICFIIIIIIITIINYRTIKDSSHFITYQFYKMIYHLYLTINKSSILFYFRAQPVARSQLRYSYSTNTYLSTIHPPRPILSSTYYLWGKGFFELWSGLWAIQQLKIFSKVF